MTEYDYSEEALERYRKKMTGIAKWVSRTERTTFTSPYTPNTPSPAQELVLRAIEEERDMTGEVFSEPGDVHAERNRQRHREREKEGKKHKQRDKDKEREREKASQSKKEEREKGSDRQEWYTTKPHRRSKSHGYDSDPVPASHRTQEHTHDERPREKHRKRDKEQSRDREADRQAKHTLQEVYPPAGYYQQGLSTFSLPQQVIPAPDALSYSRNSSKSAPPTTQHVIPQHHLPATHVALLQAPPMLSSRSKSNPPPTSHQVLYPPLHPPYPPPPQHHQPRLSTPPTTSKSKGSKSSSYPSTAAAAAPLHVSVPVAAVPIPNPIAPPLPAPLQQPAMLPKTRGGVQPGCVSYHKGGVPSQSQQYIPLSGYTTHPQGGSGKGRSGTGSGGSLPSSGVTFAHHTPPQAYRGQAPELQERQSFLKRFADRLFGNKQQPAEPRQRVTGVSTVGRRQRSRSMSY